MNFRSTTPSTEMSMQSFDDNSSDQIEISGDGNSWGKGLSNAQYGAGRRKMLDLVNRLHNTGVQLDIDLPMIAVIGSQSAGKSSLIESISGITLPRASGTCTRCPTECRLSYSPDPWKCVVVLSFITDVDGNPLGKPRNELFGRPMFDKAEVEQRIRRAQRAILNPGTPSKQFLDGVDEDPANTELTFSSNYVSLEISGGEVADLSFCDLPGLIASVGAGGSQNDIELVQSLVTRYISKPSCIILLTVACETDFENQGAHTLAKKYDPKGERTIGVLTKPDRIPPGEEGRWFKFIRNEYETLEHGWFSVKQPDSRALAAGITWDQARVKEREFFDATSPWSELAFEFRQQLGTANLTDRLSSVLSDLISTSLPSILQTLHNSVQATEDELRKLPKPPSSDAFGEVLSLLNAFSRALAEHVQGTPDANGLLQIIRPRLLRFKKAIRITAPDFRPIERPRSDMTDIDDHALVPEFLENEEDSSLLTSEALGDAIYIDDVLHRARNAITRELPNHYPFIVTQKIIQEIVGQWNIPAMRLFDEVERHVTQHVKRLVEKHFAQYPRLQQNIMTLVLDHVKTCSESATRSITWLHDLERMPMTLNDHYYSDYEDKFLAHFRAWRSQSRDASWVHVLKSVDQDEGRKSDDTGTMEEQIRSILSGYAAIGVHGLKATDLSKVLPPDPFETALKIMASARAYFQVAYKRFTDVVPRAIDHELVLGLDRDQSLDKALRAGLNINGSDARQRCAEFLQEPLAVARRRDELLKKSERLYKAKQELRDINL